MSIETAEGWKKEWRREGEAHLQTSAALVTAREECDRLRAVVRAAWPLFEDIQKIVAGWQSDPSMPRHPPELGWTPSRSRCGVAYAISDALAELRTKP